MKNYALSVATKIVIFIVGYLNPVSNLIAIVLLLMSIDFMTGLYKSIHTREKGKKWWQVVHSRKLKRSIVKFVAYTIAILTAQVIGSEFLFDLPIAQITATYAAITETASIFENLAIITNNTVFLKIYNTIATYFNRNKDVIQNINISSEEEENEPVL